MKELIIHPRIQKDYYKNKPRLSAFREAQERLKVPLCYNGDLFTPEDYREFTLKFPGTDTFMYGRGLIANPGLVTAIRTGSAPGKETLRGFHDKIYGDYQELLSGERNVLFRMKELWNYMAGTFYQSEKYAKKIKKSQHLKEYEAAVDSLFQEQELMV